MVYLLNHFNSVYSLTLEGSSPAGHWRHTHPSPHRHCTAAVPPQPNTWKTRAHKHTNTQTHTHTHTQKLMSQWFAVKLSVNSIVNHNVQYMPSGLQGTQLNLTCYMQRVTCPHYKSAHILIFCVFSQRWHMHIFTVKRTRAEQQRWFLIFFNVFFYVHMIWKNRRHWQIRKWFNRILKT